MPKTKTVREWLELLPDEIKEKAITNIIIQKSIKQLDRIHVGTLASCLNNNMNWEATPEGRYYWSEINTTLIALSI